MSKLSHTDKTTIENLIHKYMVAYINRGYTEIFPAHISIELAKLIHKELNELEVDQEVNTPSLTIAKGSCLSKAYCNTCQQWFDSQNYIGCYKSGHDITTQPNPVLYESD